MPSHQGEGNLLARDVNRLEQAPWLSLVIAAAMLTGFLVLPVDGFHLVNLYKREDTDIGCPDAFLCVRGFVPLPHALGLFTLGFGATFAAYLNVGWRL